MSKIAVLISEPANTTELIARLRKITQAGYSEIAQRLKQERPVGEWVLFENDHDDVAALLRQLLRLHAERAAKLRFFELRDDETFDLNKSQRFEISAETLSNILHTHDEQRRKLEEG